jgi:hypothetical protein
VIHDGSVPAGWFPDEHFRHRLRYWDGSRWTSWVADTQDAFVEPENKRGFDFWAMTHSVWAAVAWGIFYGLATSIAVRLADGNWNDFRHLILFNTILGMFLLGPAVVVIARRKLRKAAVRPPRTWS